MQNQILNRIPTLLALFVCVFIYVDCNFIPQNERTEIIQQKNKYRAQARKAKIMNSEIITDKSKHDVTETFFNSIAENDTVQIFYSTVSNSIQKIKIKKAGTVLVFQNDYLDVANKGWLYLFLVAFFSIIMQTGYKDLLDKNTNRGFTLLTFIFSIILLYFYLNT